MQPQGYAKENKESIKKVRKDFSLRIIRTGERYCLRCGIKFVSEDLLAQKMCENCRKQDRLL
jgi:hypothetical protein